MATALWIIVADVVLLVICVVQYRQELGLTVNGSHDEPVRRRRSVRNPPPPPVALRASGRQIARKQ
jgi:hypothetical protein